MRNIMLFIAIIVCSTITAKAQQEDIFFTQLKAIFEAKKQHAFKDCIGKQINSDDEETTYECTLKLEGFNTTIVQDEFETTFVATSSHFAVAEANIKKLLNVNTRESEGITGYTNIDDKKEKPTLYNECMNATSLYNKNEGNLDIQICEKPSRLGFVIKIN